jgi:hypothetical protein
MFMPQWPTHGSYNDLHLLPSPELMQCDKILEKIFSGLEKLMDLIMFSKEYDEAQKFLDELRDRGELEEVETEAIAGARNTLNDERAVQWAQKITDVIMELIKTYQNVRPQENQEILYRRILQNLYSEFRRSWGPMSDTTATNVLTYLLNKSPNIKSDEFKQALRVMFELLMINWELPPNPNAIIARTNLMKTEIICLTHDIEITNRDANQEDETQWSYSHRGAPAPYNYRRMQERTSHANHTVHNQTRLRDLHKQFETSKDRFNDIQYIVHRMQKPAFEMPNPVILSTFLRSGSQSIPVSAEGATAHDKDNRHSFYDQFLAYFKESDDSRFIPQGNIMENVIKTMFAVYNDRANHMWSVSSTVPAATYMQNNATELPSCAYHGNLFIDKLKGMREEIRCVGHLGNSFPGSSTIRQGKGMLNMYERMPMPIHVM